MDNDRSSTSIGAGILTSLLIHAGLAGGLAVFGDAIGKSGEGAAEHGVLLPLDAAPISPEKPKDPQKAPEEKKPRPTPDEEEESKLKLGIEDGVTQTETWLGYKDPTPHSALPATIDQASFTIASGPMSEAKVGGEDAQPQNAVQASASSPAIAPQNEIPPDAAPTAASAPVAASTTPPTELIDPPEKPQPPTPDTAVTNTPAPAAPPPIPTPPTPPVPLAPPLPAVQPPPPAPTQTPDDQSQPSELQTPVTDKPAPDSPADPATTKPGPRDEPLPDKPVEPSPADPALPDATPADAPSKADELPPRDLPPKDAPTTDDRAIDAESSQTAGKDDAKERTSPPAPSQTPAQSETQAQPQPQAPPAAESAQALASRSQQPPTTPSARQSPSQPLPGSPGQAPRTSGTRPGASGRPGERTDQYADATSTMRDVIDVVPGRPAAAKGLKIKTTPPQWGVTTTLLRAARNPVVAITFGKSGKVIKAGFVKGQNAGSPDVDGPLLDAIHEWQAEGEAIKKLPATPDAGVTIFMRITLRGL